MGYFSCNSESAIIACDPYNWDRKRKSSSKNRKTRKSKSPKIRKFCYADLESSTGGFSSQSFLGRGSHGSVYKAVLNDGKLIVAVKKMTAAATTTSLQEDNKNAHNVTPGENEVEILSRIRSPRFVNLLGFSFDSQENKLIVVEFMPNGSLYDLLHSNPRPPGWVKRLRFALQIAKAVETLHTSNPPVIHRDIKSSNVLMDCNWNARLGDFGLALRGYVEDVRKRCTPPAGTLGYLDPGYVAPENLSSKSDVFSFGILLLEIVSGRNAIDVNYSPPSVIDWALPLIKQGDFLALCDHRIGPPEDLSVIQNLAMLAAHCVRSKAGKRPSMAEVVDYLRVVNKRVASRIWNNFRRQSRKPRLAIKHEVFDAGEEVVKTSKHGSKTSSLRSRKVSSVQPSVDFGRGLSGNVSDRIGRSNSIGSISEIKAGPDSNVLVNRIALVQRKSGLTVRMPAVKLIKSRSLGLLEGARLVHDSEQRLVFQLVRNPQVRGLDISKLVLSEYEGSKTKIVEKKQSS